MTEPQRKSVSTDATGTRVLDARSLMLSGLPEGTAPMLLGGILGLLNDNYGPILSHALSVSGSSIYIQFVEVAAAEKAAVAVGPQLQLLLEQAGVAHSSGAKAVVTVSRAKADPRQVIASSSVIVLKNLPYNTTQAALSTWLTSLDPKPISVDLHHEGGRFQGVAFAKYGSVDDARRVMSAIHAASWGGRTIKAEYKRLVAGPHKGTGGVHATPGMGTPPMSPFLAAVGAPGLTPLLLPASAGARGRAGSVPMGSPLMLGASADPRSPTMAAMHAALGGTGAPMDVPFLSLSATVTALEQLTNTLTAAALAPQQLQQQLPQQQPPLISPLSDGLSPVTGGARMTSISSPTMVGAGVAASPFVAAVQARAQSSASSTGPGEHAATNETATHAGAESRGEAIAEAPNATKGPAAVEASGVHATGAAGEPGETHSTAPAHGQRHHALSAAAPEFSPVLGPMASSVPAGGGAPGGPIMLDPMSAAAASLAAAFGMAFSLAASSGGVGGASATEQVKPETSAGTDAHATHGAGGHGKPKRARAKTVSSTAESGAAAHPAVAAAPAATADTVADWRNASHTSHARPKPAKKGDKDKDKVKEKGTAAGDGAGGSGKTDGANRRARAHTVHEDVPTEHQTEAAGSAAEDGKQHGAKAHNKTPAKAARKSHAEHPGGSASHVSATAEATTPAKPAPASSGGDASGAEGPTSGTRRPVSTIRPADGTSWRQRAAAARGRTSSDVGGGSGHESDAGAPTAEAAAAASVPSIPSASPPPRAPEGAAGNATTGTAAATPPTASAAGHNPGEVRFAKGPTAEDRGGVGFSARLRGRSRAESADVAVQSAASAAAEASASTAASGSVPVASTGSSA